MPALVSDIVSAVINELSQVPGPSTQIYGTPRILQYVQDAFDFCFQANWWDGYTSFWTATLDGTTGRLTADILPTTPTSSPVVPITSYTNIRNCYPDGTHVVIKQLPARVNPTLLNQVSASMPIFRSADYMYANRPIIFYPASASGNVIMEVRQEPLHPFALTDTLYLDALMLTLGASYMYAADDGTNPGQINKFQSLFMKRLNDMIAAEGEAAVMLDPRFMAEQDQWWEMT